MSRDSMTLDTQAAGFVMRQTTTGLLALLPLLAIASSLAAQSGAADTRATFASRSELEREVATAEAAAASARSAKDRRLAAVNAATIRARLTTGDFDVGASILLRVDEHAALSDTFSVRFGRMLELPSLPDLDLTGVLRSELEPTLTAHVARFVRSPRVRAIPLVRIAVSGHVARPGFHLVAADTPLADVIMLAGGPLPSGDLDRVSVQRESAELWRAEEVRIAFAQGMSLDELHLRAGDEIHVGERGRRDWVRAAQTAAAVGGLASFLVTLMR